MICSSEDTIYTRDNIVMRGREGKNAVYPLGDIMYTDILSKFPRETFGELKKYGNTFITLDTFRILRRTYHTLPENFFSVLKIKDGKIISLSVGKYPLFSVQIDQLEYYNSRPFFEE